MTGPTPTAALIRAAQVVGAVAVGLAAPTPAPFVTVLIVAGVVAAVASPDRIGSGLALAGVGAAFLAGGRDVAPGTVLVAAAGLYLLHTATALAAICPWSARVPPTVLGRWAWRCLPAVVLTAAAVGVDATLGRVPVSPLFAVAATLLALGAAIALVRVLEGVRP